MKQLPLNWVEEAASAGIERYEYLIKQKLDYSGERYVPLEIRDALSVQEVYDDNLVGFLCSNSIICDCAKNEPASDRITRRVYFSGPPRPLGLTSVDAFISYSLGGRALYNRLFSVSSLLQPIISEMQRVYVLDLGSGSGSYAFETIRMIYEKGLSQQLLDMKWHCVDLSQISLDYGMKMAEKEWSSETVTFENANFLSSKFLTKYADLIVIVGVLCGMTINEAEKCLSKVKQYLSPTGEIVAATLLVQSFYECPLVYQMLAKLGWHLKPKTIEEVEHIFKISGFEIINIHSERKNIDNVEVPGEYAIVRAKLR